MTKSLSADSTSKKTAFVSTNYTHDTDMQQFTKIPHRTPLPSIQRVFRFHIPQVVEPIMLIDINSIIIGRASGDDRLDLSLQYGKMLGVSRNHAQLSFSHGKYYLMDLDSRNGTFLNNKLLTPNEPVAITQNDQIRFGHFVAIVNYAEDLPQ